MISRSKKPAKTVLLYLSMAFLCVVFIEICASVSYWIVRDDVDLWSGWRSTVDERDYQRFLKRNYDPDTGWNSPRDRVVKGKNCLGKKWIRTFDVNGARVHSSEPHKPVQILVVGDSFAAGAEVNDNETFPAQLEQLAGVRVANHGIGASGPTQALINLQNLVESYSDVKVIIFSVMHENIRRMANSFRPAYMPTTGKAYGFKPFVMNGEWRENQNAPPAETLLEFQELARKAFREDFWSRGEWSFPYILSWINFAQSDYFYFEIKTRLAKLSGESSTGYIAYYESDRLRRDLMFILESFYDLARSANAQPIVLFIPKIPGDLTSARPIIEELRDRFGKSEMTVIDVGQMDIDWNAFNLKPGECHPSPYGYKMIATSIVEHLDF